MLRRKRMLTLDGGGVRGLSSLLILRKLLCLVNEELTGEHTPVPVTDIFDLVAGTSTGGLMALMLVKLDLPVDQCIAEYKNLARSIFSHRTLTGRLTAGLSISRYSGKRLAEEIRRLVVSSGFDEDLKMDDNKHHIKTMCTVVCRELEGDWDEKRVDEPVFLCSRPCRPHDPNSYTACTVADAARATSAAPTYFPKVELFDKVLVDGAYGNTNNPSEAIYRHFNEFHELWHDPPRPLFMVNVGTGVMPPRVTGVVLTPPRPWWSYFVPKIFLHVWRITRDLSAIATETEAVARQLDGYARSAGPQVLHFVRFSEDGHLFKIGLDDWKCVEDGHIERYSEEYLQREDVLDQLRDTARDLALHSRAHRSAQRRGTLRSDITTTATNTPLDDTPADAADTTVDMEVSNLQGKHLQTLELPQGTFSDLKAPVIVRTDTGRDIAISPTRRSSNPLDVFHNARIDLQEATSPKPDGQGGNHDD